MAFCPQCGVEIKDNAAFCGGCGRPTSMPAASGFASAQASAVPTSTPMADNVAGMLAYVTIIPAIIFLVVQPYSKNKFVRFHAFQSIFCGIAWFVLWTVMSIVLTPILGFWVAHSFMSLISLAAFALWLFLLFKAYQGQMFKVPVVGDLAEKQANSL